VVLDHCDGGIAIRDAGLDALSPRRSTAKRKKNAFVRIESSPTPARSRIEIDDGQPAVNEYAVHTLGGRVAVGNQRLTPRGSDSQSPRQGNPQQHAGESTTSAGSRCMRENDHHGTAERIEPSKARP